MRTLATAYVATGLMFLLLDAAYLSIMGNRFYRPQLAPLLRDGFALGPAVVFYLIYVAGLVMFAVLPGLTAQSLLTAALHGAAFGFVTYATYDLTNQATLRDWPLAVTVVDMAWGTVLGTVASSAGYAVTAWVSRA